MRITVVIPVKNGSATLDRCLSSISNQTLGAFVELIILDSMSTDGSREIAKKYNASIIDIPSGTFDHGGTRNIGVKAANSDIIFFTVQDAYLSDENMLGVMLNHFKDTNVMAVTGHQAVPHDKDKNPAVWFKRMTEPMIEVKHFVDPLELQYLNPAEKLSKLGWDNVVSMYRKMSLLELPFIKTEFAEDAFWCYEALLKGWKLIYDPSVVVYHYHHKSFDYSYKVSWSVNYHLFSFFKLKPTLPAFFSMLVKRIYQLVKNNRLTFSEKLYWINYNLKSDLGNFMAVSNFLWTLRFFGRQGIEKSYLKNCEKIPQGKQKIGKH